jgi:hypothetical protein
VGRDSSVGIATRYGLDGPVIESWWKARFSEPVQTSPRAHPASYTMGNGSFPGAKWPGRGVDHPLPPRAEVKERVELYLYSPSGPFWPVLGCTLPSPLPLSRWGLLQLLAILCTTLCVLFPDFSPRGSALAGDTKRFFFTAARTRSRWPQPAPIFAN